ncbi:MAG: bifunctional metallophosphatase/5'-nucleotidase [Bacteroidales bacterium]|nr:bifunctional metallophosphatase/5'-nucleotidase [Bacteroidales bacterium]
MKKTLTLLHSNDLHGDFLAEKVDEKLTGGVSMLSGYISKVRKEEKNVLYAISGDMFKGSLIDQEYRGISTIEIMNLLAPDVVTLGNHEVDYGLAHLLFLEKCAKFPIINANMFLTSNGTRLFHSHKIIEIDGMKIMFIGILTEDVLEYTRNEKLISTLVGIKDAAEEVGRICMAYQTVDIDLTVLLTHIGYENDQKLAAQLDPDWGVDLIIGGHSHTLIDKPAVVAGIPIVQAAVGTDQIGRFDLLIDTDTNSIASYTWKLIPITEENCPRDLELERVVANYKSITDAVYEQVLTRLDGVYTQTRRNRDSTLGHLFTDIVKEGTGVDIVMISSGAIRGERLGEVVTKGDLRKVFPYDNKVVEYKLTGKQFRDALLWMFRDESIDAPDDGGEFYQLSRGVKVVYNQKEHRIETLELNGRAVGDDDLIKIAMGDFHYNNIDNFLHLDKEDIKKNGPVKTLSSSDYIIIEERMSGVPLIRVDKEERIVIK